MVLKSLFVIIVRRNYNKGEKYTYRIEVNIVGRYKTV